MATRAERFRSEQQQASGASPRTSKKRPKKSQWSRVRAHAGRKAVHAFDDAAPGERPSRESTRASANRAKSDAALNVTEETRKGAPTNRSRNAAAKRARVRGSRQS